MNSIDGTEEDWAPHPAVAEALGSKRVAGLGALSLSINDLDGLTHDAGTIEIVLVPLDKTKARRWEQRALARHEDWMFAKSSSGEATLAIDEPSEVAIKNPAAAVTYPELHTRLVAWWLCHTWRAVDLCNGALAALAAWRITSAPIVVRALVEQLAVLKPEAEALTQAWARAKALPPGVLERPSEVRSIMHPLLMHASFDSRLPDMPDNLRAKNIQTYIDKLAKSTRDDRFKDWYNLLSDSSHPSFGARIALAGQPMVHQDGPVMTRAYARSPLSLVSRDGTAQHLVNEVAETSAEALVVSGLLVWKLLVDTLLLVDDFGLTTGAATYTNRRYWRGFAPVKGSRACPCGRGRWATCNHRWGEATPPANGLPPPPPSS
jgi:hypothetical protein